MKSTKILKFLCVVFGFTFLALLLWKNLSPIKEMPLENQVLKVIHERKSVRDYTEQQVSIDDLNTLVRAGMAAPTARNMQPWAFIIVNEKEVMSALVEKMPQAKMLTKANAAIIVCGDMTKALEGMGREYWVQDCSAATQNILLAAESMGLGAVWIGGYPSDRATLIQEALGLPEHIIPLNIISVGYPTGKEEPKDKWNESNVHYNVWRK